MKKLEIKYDDISWQLNNDLRQSKIQSLHYYVKIVPQSAEIGDMVFKF